MYIPNLFIPPSNVPCIKPFPGQPEMPMCDFGKGQLPLDQGYDSSYKFTPTATSSVNTTFTKYSIKIGNEYESFSSLYSLNFNTVNYNFFYNNDNNGSIGILENNNVVSDYVINNSAPVYPSDIFLSGRNKQLHRKDKVSIKLTFQKIQGDCNDFPFIDFDGSFKLSVHSHDGKTTNLSFPIIESENDNGDLKVKFGGTMPKSFKLRSSKSLSFSYNIKFRTACEDLPDAQLNSYDFNSLPLLNLVPGFNHKGG